MSKVITTVTDPNRCPQGTRAEKVVYPTMYGVPVDSGKWNCVAGEGLLCEWFGWFCEGPVVNPPAAPQTVAELTIPGEWTPEKSAGVTHEQYLRNVDLWLDNTSGVARVPAATYRAGESAKEFAVAATPWVLIGVLAAGYIALKILTARVR